MKRCLLNKIIKTSAVLLLAAFSFSCQLFDNDVNDFMEKYTETAAIEEHSLSEKTYSDNSGNSCINSKKNAIINSLDYYLSNKLCNKKLYSIYCLFIRGKEINNNYANLFI